MNKKVLMIILVLVMALSLSAYGSEETAKQVPRELDIISTGIEYEIVEKNEFDKEYSNELNWKVIVKEKVNAEELKELSKEIIEIAKEEKPFNAITIWLYDYEEYAENEFTLGRYYAPDGFTLGRVRYAPEGDCDKADTVKTGDYNKMDYNYYVMEKDWDKRLTKEEVEIYKAWKDLYHEKNTGSDLPDEDKVSEEVANEFNVSKKEVNEIMLKQITWALNDIDK